MRSSLLVLTSPITGLPGVSLVSVSSLPERHNFYNLSSEARRGGARVCAQKSSSVEEGVLLASGGKGLLAKTDRAHH